jgi:hypothetical protein
VAAGAAILLGVLLMFAPSVLDVAPGPATSFSACCWPAGAPGRSSTGCAMLPASTTGPDDGAVV